MIYIVPVAQNFQENYSIGVNDSGALVMVVEGTEYTLEKDSTVDNVVVTRQSNGEYVIQINYESGNKSFTVPGFMRSTVLNYLDNNDIEYKLYD
jgi:hypothetical protein